MNPQHETSSHEITPPRWDEIMDSSDSAAFAYVMAMIEITRDLLPVDRDTFLHLGLVRMMRKFEEHSIYLDFSELAEAADSIVDADGMEILRVAVNEAIERSVFAHETFGRMSNHIGLERAQELEHQARRSIVNNTARECAKAIESTMQF